MANGAQSHWRRREPSKLKAQILALPIIALALGALAACAQQIDDPQSGADRFCEDTHVSGGSPEGVAQCRLYYARHPDYWQPHQALATLPAAAANYPPPPAPPPSAAPGVTEVALLRRAGTVTVPVVINGALRIGCMVDSGASDVALPADVVMTLLRTGTLRDSDFLGKKVYVLADGSKLPSVTFRIRSLKVGDKILNNVTGSASSAAGEPLLGQSFLSRFKSWSIDNARGVLVLE